MTTAASRRVDAALVLMVLIWGVNYSLMKRTFAEIPPQPFNALRMVVSTTVFLTAIAWARRAARRGVAVSRIFYTDTPMTPADRWLLVGCGIVGHFIYQSCFVAGVAATSVSNSALIVGATPVVVAIASAALGHERIGRLHWLGAVSGVRHLLQGHPCHRRGAHVAVLEPRARGCHDVCRPLAGRADHAHQGGRHGGGAYRAVSDPAREPTDRRACRRVGAAGPCYF